MGVASFLLTFPYLGLLLLRISDFRDFLIFLADCAVQCSPENVLLTLRLVHPERAIENTILIVIAKTLIASVVLFMRSIRGRSDSDWKPKICDSDRMAIGRDSGMGCAQKISNFRDQRSTEWPRLCKKSPFLEHSLPNPSCTEYLPSLTTHTHPVKGWQFTPSSRGRGSQTL